MFSDAEPTLLGHDTATATTAGTSIVDESKPAVDPTERDVTQVVEAVHQAVEAERNKPFVVAVMGQTGVGKSSLLNALFNAGFKTDAVRPCTKISTAVSRRADSGQEVIFWDMPGLGEREAADDQYLSDYRGKLRDADLCIWAVQADTRAAALEARLLERILETFDSVDRRSVLRKFSFVLTKADVLASPPWILGPETDTGRAKFVSQIDELLAEKSDFFESEVIAPVASDRSTTTHNDVPTRIAAPGFTYSDDEMLVTFDGYMSEKDYRALARRYPDHEPLLQRIRRASRFVPCSAVFRFNLSEVLAQMLTGLSDEAFVRFRELLAIDTIDTFADPRAPMEMRNILVLDAWDGRNRVIDLPDVWERDRRPRWFQFLWRTP